MGQKSVGKSATPGWITSVRALGAAIGRSHKQAIKYLKDPRWTFARRGPWPMAQLAEMRGWVAGLQEDRSDAGDAAAGGELDNIGRARTIAQIKVLVEREANLRVDRLIKEKKFVSREEHEEATAKKWAAVKTSLQRFPRGLRPALLIFLEAAEANRVEQLLTDGLRTLCNDGFGGKRGKDGEA